MADAEAPRDILFDRARARIAGLNRHFIAGHWQAQQGGAPIPVLNPADERQIGEIAAGTAHEVDAAVSAARAAFDHPGWRAMPAARREQLLLHLADLIERQADEIAAMETLDNGMPFAHARGAVAGAVSAIRYNAGWVRRLGGETVPVSVPGDWHGYTTRDPLGVAALIVPWNAPFAITCSKVSAALAAGCTVVLKPAELAPMTGLRLAELVAEAGFPDGSVNVVTGLGSVAGAALVAHPDVDKISFTGSTATGQGILRASIADLRRVSLELGGKSAVLVMEDADLRKAVPGVAMGIFGNSGQVCAAGSRLFVADAIYEPFMTALLDFARGLRVGPGIAEGVVMGPLISAQQRDRVLGYIEAGKREGATLALGGDCPDGPGYFVNPTIFVDARPEMSIVREEIFGPVLSVMRFGDADLDALARAANDSVYGLSAYVWTRDLAAAHGLAKRLRAGSVKVNGAGMEFALPFGGFRQSGLGRENGRYGVEAFTETKAVMIAY